MIMELADEVKVALVTATCILGITIIFKNILHVQADLLVTNSPIYLLIVYIIVKDQTKKSKYCRPIYWSLAIIFVTLLIIALYAI